MLGPLLMLQQKLHREIQVTLFLITRRADITMALFSIIFFPGILLHEGSHYVVARLLGVRTGKFSLIPHQIEKGKLRLGFVETAQTDWLRDALIGTAPLLSGGTFVAYTGLIHLGLLDFWRAYNSGYFTGMLGAVHNLTLQTDFWIWFYLALVVSSTMFPSASDRRAWLPLGFICMLLLVVSLYFGAGTWLVGNLSEPLNRTLLTVAMIFGVSIVVHLVFLPPIWFTRYLIEWLSVRK
jgi:hypothetical protein